jgi:hypothetical protein
MVVTMPLILPLVSVVDDIPEWRRRVGRGFGGQLLLVIPARDTVAVAYAWNVFGSPARNLAQPLIAVLTAAP